MFVYYSAIKFEARC